MTEVIYRTATGAVVYDPLIIQQPGPELFDADSWRRTGTVSAAAGGGGRGATLFVSGRAGDFVLRHYYRGGLPRHLLRDRYCWLGESRTRSILEWRLLQQLRAWNLPVPSPVAAGYSRRGLTYTADILTVRLKDVRALSECMADSDLDATLWSLIGTVIRRFHDRGVCHADLSAHNIQVSRNGEVYLLDFDRGSIRSPGAWIRRNLGRLHRSLIKISTGYDDVRFSDRDWAALMAGYAACSVNA